MVERELKFDVGPGFVVPDVQSDLPSGTHKVVSTEQLRSEYYDTADHALLRARMVLRRRTGSTDTGWQLKIPDGSFREEIRIEGQASERVPEELTELLTGVSRRQPLQPIAIVTTRRSATQLLTDDGELLAEVDDDQVQATVPGRAATTHQWREIEVELGSGDLTILDAVAKQLRHAGAQPSTSPSKLVRALPGALTTQPRPSSGSDVGEVLAAYLADQHQAILGGDLALRRGNARAVHKTRVATRRFRSTLRVFHGCYDPERSAALDAELRWYADLLGQVRDRQVLRKRLGVMLGHLDSTLLFGPVRARIDSELRQEQSDHWERLVSALHHERYLTMVADLDEWINRPPHSSSARHRGAEITTPLRRAERKALKRLRTASRSGEAASLHRARKAAKRARYAAEAAKPVIGKTATKRRVHQYCELQDLLGEHQDSIVSAEFLRRLGAVAGTTPGENGFSYGILHEREEHNAYAARTKAQRVAKKLL